MRSDLVELRRFGPRPPDDRPNRPPCPACHKPFTAGDYTTIIALGPGDDPKERRKAREGRAYNAVGIVVHWACATGEEAEG